MPSLSTLAAPIGTGSAVRKETQCWFSGQVATEPCNFRPGNSCLPPPLAGEWIDIDICVAARTRGMSALGEVAAYGRGVMPLDLHNGILPIGGARCIAFGVAQRNPSRRPTPIRDRDKSFFGADFLLLGRGPESQPGKAERYTYLHPTEITGFVPNIHNIEGSAELLRPVR